MAAPLAPQPMQSMQARFTGLWYWLRQNLFPNWIQATISIALGWMLAVLLYHLATWVWTGASWDVVPANLRLFLSGRYPQAELWRLWCSVYVLSVLWGASAGVWRGYLVRLGTAAAAVGLVACLLPVGWGVRAWLLGFVALLAAGFFVARGRMGARRFVIGGWIGAIPVTLALVRGMEGLAVLPVVNTTVWGGLLLTLILAVVGIAASFPIGVLLALGRRSRLPAIRWVCTGYIELMRGIPLVSVVFMAQIVVPIFLPGARIDKVVRAMIGFILFTAAYIAENVRGGLQGVPKGQYEAAEAIGLSGVKRTLLIILPQALRSVIPSTVGQFISLFKDTSLVVVVGLIDLLGVARSVTANPNWLGLDVEVYVFAAAIYWIFSFNMSYASRQVERGLGVGERT